MRKILVVDNNPLILKLMENFLTKEGHRVVLAVDGLDALEKAESFKPEIYFIDLVMPKISGDKLCRIIRSRTTMQDAFLVILSAVAVEEEIDFKSFGADACIAKGPFKEVGLHVRSVIEDYENKTISHLATSILGTDKVYKRVATEELLFTKKHFETTLSHMLEGFFELTLDHEIVYVNPAATQLLALSEELILSTQLTDYFQGSNQEQLKDALNDLQNTSPITLGEKTTFCLGNTSLLATLIMVKPGFSSSIIVILNDISERKRDEEELKQYRNNLESLVQKRSEELSEEHEKLVKEIEEKRQIEVEKMSLEQTLQQTHKLEALGTMATGIAHDFNNILTAVIGFTELTLRELKDNDSLSSNLNQVIKASRRAKDLIRSILTFSRQKEQVFSSITIQSILKEVLKLLRATTPDNIRVLEDIDESCAPVHADATQIHQVVLNLYTNALQAMKEKGTITVSLHPSVYNPNAKSHPQVIVKNFVELKIADTGTGIDSEQIEKIFDPYFTTKEAGEGTGMGLAVVHGIVTSHGGTVSVKSRPGKGSTFSVQFPVTVTDVYEEIGEETEELSGSEHILIVDDDPAILMIIAQFLNKLGYKTTSARNGAEAIERFSKNKDSIHAMLTDMTMPGMNGLSLSKEIIKMSPDLPIILCSGRHILSTISEEELTKFGITSFLYKPFTLAALSKVVKQALTPETSS